MTDHAEEQEMEAEALLAIFDTHFEITGDSNWTVEIYPEAGADETELDKLNHVGCQLLIELPPDYPENLPQLNVKILKGLTEEHASELQRLAVEEAQANLGVPSIFAVAERLREWLADNNVKGLDDRSMHAQMMRKQQEQDKKVAEKAQLTFESQKQQTEMTEAEREELEVHKRRAEGTPCNKENFEAWQAKFLREMEEAKKAAADNDDGTATKGKGKSKTKEADKAGRLTGFLCFSNKVDNLEALEAAAEEAAQDFEDVDEELFDEDVDLDDLDFDEEDDEEEEEEEEELDI